MTFRDRLEYALDKTDGITDDLNALLAFAYYVGRHDAAKEACDMADERFQAQQERAKQCRYYKMAKAIIGEAIPRTHGKGFIYHSDYSNDYDETFGDAIWPDDDSGIEEWTK